MSKSTVKTGKKVISQNELRRIMSEQKKKLSQNVKKIDSPLAKYTESGELRCILCDSGVRGEAVWGAHLASREHLANIAAAKRSRDRMNAPPPPKRTLPMPQPPAKKPKGILKNCPPPKAEVPADFFDPPAGSKVTSKVELKTERGLLLGEYSSDEEEEDVKPNVPVVPASILARNAKQKEVREAEAELSSKPGAPGSSDTLPEGFFDDPKLDAKVRNVEYRDPVEEEWEKFQRAIKSEAEQSQQIIQEEQEEATAERQLDEIDEQMRNWSRVIELERRKEQVAAETLLPATQKVKLEEGTIKEEPSDDEADFDEFLDWRAKQS